MGVWLAVGALALAVTPSLAVAQGPDQPGKPGKAVSGGSGRDKQIGSLPFTGVDLLIVTGVALLLTGTGLALRPLSPPKRPSL